MKDKEEKEVREKKWNGDRRNKMKQQEEEEEEIEMEKEECWEFMLDVPPVFSKL